jgi:hypothetical protein
MGFYDLNTDFIGSQLTPPKLRQSKLTAWIQVLLRPLDVFHNNTFIPYKESQTYTVYDDLESYSFGDIVLWTDKATYECIVTTTIGVNPTVLTTWRKVNDIFIGADERVQYNSQKILFEYALNNYFQTTGIYIENNFNNADTVFVMGNTGEFSSAMPNLVSPLDYMANVPTFSTTSDGFTIFVPLFFCFTTLGPNYENIIRSFANKYVLAGITYGVQTY